jgi:hypothetical protein
MTFELAPAYHPVNASIRGLATGDVPQSTGKQYDSLLTAPRLADRLPSSALKNQAERLGQSSEGGDMHLAFAAPAGSAFRAPALDRLMGSQRQRRDGSTVLLPHRSLTTDPAAADCLEETLTRLP